MNHRVSQARRPAWAATLLATAALAISTPASAQDRVDCSPAIFDFGTLSSLESVGVVSCQPLVAPGEPGYTVLYQGTFQFTLAEPADFYAYLTGTFRFPIPMVSGQSGVGYSGTLYFGDQFLTGASGTGIGGAERPALLNPDFASPSISTNGLEPAGTYTVPYFGRGFGDQPYGNIRLTIYGGAPVNPPVTPVPEPATLAAQGLGLALLGGIWAARRARQRRT